MINPKATIALFLCLSACGRHLVEFPFDGSAGDGASSADGSTDASSDAFAESSTDAQFGDAAGAPVVVSTVPAMGANNVSINKKPTATFDQAMDPTTVIPANFSLMQGATLVTCTVKLDALTNTVTFTPVNPLGLSLPYTAVITTGTKSAGGIPMAANYSWNFTTGPCSQASVVLGGASNFAVLGGATVTNTGPTLVTGDLGVSPGSAVTGFPPGVLIGTQHAADSTSATGMADLTTAYNEAAARVVCPVTVAGNIGGQTLNPGLYKSTSSLAISAGDLTLDAQGDSDGVFIFQIASTLTTTAGRKVILTNGAKSGNVYWQVGTFATLGANGDFQGTVMADQTIMMITGGSLNGRALARIGAVNLDSNPVTRPTP